MKFTKSLTALQISLATFQTVLIAPLLVGAPEIAFAATYATVAQARISAFPTANRFEEAILPESMQVRDQTIVQRAYQNNQLLGFFVFDAVIGKHLYIDYSVSLSPTGSILRTEILEYRENYGSEVSERAWLRNFEGKGDKSIELGAEIPNISGATYSAKHITQGINEIAGLIRELINTSKS